MVAFIRFKCFMENLEEEDDRNVRLKLGRTIKQEMRARFVAQ